MEDYFSKVGGFGSLFGQYRSEIFPDSPEQEEAIRRLMRGKRVPIAAPGSPEARFWSAEDYHQKYALRRNKNLIAALQQQLGPRWGEHVYATKLNAVGARGFDVKPWLAEMSAPIVDAFRGGSGSRIFGCGL